MWLQSMVDFIKGYDPQAVPIFFLSGIEEAQSLSRPMVTNLLPNQKTYVAVEVEKNGFRDFLGSALVDRLNTK